MLRRSVSVSLRPRDILKLTFLFLASFVQARLLPAQAEKSPRACTQCRKSAFRADFTSFVKCNAQRAQCIAQRVFCTVSDACCSVFSAMWELSDASRIAHPALCITPGAPCIPSCATRLLADAQWHARNDICAAPSVARQMADASRFERSAACEMASGIRPVRRASRRLDAASRHLLALARRELRGHTDTGYLAESFRTRKASHG